MRNPDSGEAAEHRTKDGVTARVHFHDLQPPTADMRAEVLAGLGAVEDLQRRLGHHESVAAVVTGSLVGHAPDPAGVGFM